MKKCFLCQLEQPLSEFHKTQRACKPCLKAYNRKRYDAKRDEILTRNKLYATENKEKVYDLINGWGRKQKHLNPAKYLWRSAKNRAAKKGLEFTITPEDIFIPEVCPVLGIELQINDGKQAMNSPSLDRIDSAKGYTPDNIIVISWRANLIKRDATIEELKKISEFYSKYGEGYE